MGAPTARLLAVVSLATPLLTRAGKADFDHVAQALDKKNFSQFLDKERVDGRPALVMFHVDWCKVCQRVFPKFANASNMVQEGGFPMDFAHVDCTDDKSLCTQYEVKGYPTLKLFRPKEGAAPMPFTSPRTEQSFVRYAERMTQPAVQSYANSADLVAALGKESMAAVLLSMDSASLSEDTLGVAEKWMDRHIFAAASSGEVASLLPPELAAGCPSSGCVAAIFAPAEQQWRGSEGLPAPPAAAAFYTEPLANATAFGEWIAANRFPGVWTVGEASFFAFTHSGRRTALVAVDPASVSEGDAQLIREVAHELRGEFIFGVVDGVAWADELSDFNIAKADLPRVLVTEKDLSEWVEDIEQLRFDSFESDLRALVEGAPLLRQSRGAWSRLQVYLRETQRGAAGLQAFAAKGPKQMAMVAAGALLALGVVALFFWFMSLTCSAIFSDDIDGYETQKRD